MGTAIASHWGRVGTIDTVAVPDSGTTYHPHDITVSNIQIDSMVYASAVGALMFSASYNVNVTNVKIQYGVTAIWVHAGDFGYRYAQAPDLDTAFIEGQGFHFDGVFADSLADVGIKVVGITANGESEGGLALSDSIWAFPIHVSNSSFRGDETGIGISLSYCQGAVIDNCYFDNFLIGMSNGAGVERLKVLNSTFIRNEQSGISISNGTLAPIDILIKNCYIADNDQSGGGSRTGITVGQATRTILDGNRIGLAPNEATIYGIEVTSSGSATTVINNYVYDAATRAYDVRGDSTDIIEWRNNTSALTTWANGDAAALRAIRRLGIIDDSLFLFGHSIAGTIVDNFIMKINITGSDTSWAIEADVGAAGGTTDTIAFSLGDTTKYQVDKALKIKTGAGLLNTPIADSSGIDTTTLSTVLGTSVDLTAEVTGVLPVANGGSLFKITTNRDTLSYEGESDTLLKIVSNGDTTNFNSPGNSSFLFNEKLIVNNQIVLTGSGLFTNVIFPDGVGSDADLLQLAGGGNDSIHLSSEFVFLGALDNDSAVMSKGYIDGVAGARWIDVGTVDTVSLFGTDTLMVLADTSIYTSIETENVGGFLFLDRVTIDGTVDSVQLRVQGFSSQTDEIVRVELSDGSEIFSIHADGASHFTHTSTQNDEFSVLFNSNAAGFGGMKAIDIDYVTGNTIATEEGVAVLVQFDQDASTGGDFFGIEILTTTTGGAEVHGLGAGVGVIPIIQESGTFGNLTFAEAESGGGGYSDWVARGNSAVSDTTLWAADNDTTFIGFATTFEELEWIWNTVATKNMFFKFLYSTGAGAWTEFSPIDGTNGAINNGVMAWDRNDLAGWSSESVDGDAAFWVAIVRERNTATGPTEEFVQIADPINYEWDENGNIIANSFRLEGTEDAFEHIITGVDATADRTFTLPNDDLADLDLMIGTGPGTFGYVAMSGDATLANTGALTIGTDKITSAKILDDEIVKADTDTTTDFTATGYFKLNAAVADSELVTHAHLRLEIEDSLNEYSLTTAILLLADTNAYANTIIASPTFTGIIHIPDFTLITGSGTDAYDATDVPTNGQVLTWTAGVIDWRASSSSVNWDAIGAPGGDGSIDFANTNQTIVMSHTAGASGFIFNFNQVDDGDALDYSMVMDFDITSESGDADDSLRVIDITYEEGTANTIMDAAISINNLETTTATMTDGIIIKSDGVNLGVTDGIDVSDANILNAINIGVNIIKTGAQSIASTELDRLSGVTGALTFVGGTDVTIADGGTGQSALDDIVGGDGVTVAAGTATIIGGDATISITGRVDAVLDPFGPPGGAGSIGPGDSVILELGSHEATGKYVLYVDSSINDGLYTDSVYIPFRMPAWANQLDSIFIVWKGKSTSADTSEISLVEVHGPDRSSPTGTTDSLYATFGTDDQGNTIETAAYQVNNTELGPRDPFTIMIEHTLGASVNGVVRVYSVYAVVSE